MEAVLAKVGKDVKRQILSHLVEVEDYLSCMEVSFFKGAGSAELHKRLLLVRLLEYEDELEQLLISGAQAEELEERRSNYVCDESTVEEIEEAIDWTLDEIDTWNNKFEMWTAELEEYQFEEEEEEDISDDYYMY
jgi:hypothetical protein